MVDPVVSVIVPTKDRRPYLEVALDSLLAQHFDGPSELIVVDDRSSDDTALAVAARGLRRVTPDGHGGLNAARNAGAAAARAPLLAFVDDDVWAPPGWLAALIEGAARHPGALAFGGPIRARLEGPAPRSCGRERAPITSLDLGPRDHEATLVWGANLLVRRRALDLVGPFDETIGGGGDEEEWLGRLRAAGGSVVYLAAAGLDHRRAGDDVRLRSLMRGAFRRGRDARRLDRRRAAAPGLGREVRVLAGCGWHTLRRACPQGLVMGAHSAGRTVEAVRET